MWGSERLLLNHTDPRQTPGQTCELGETLAVALWNQGDIAGEKFQLTKLNSRRGRPGSKESVLMKRTNVCSHCRTSMCMYFETIEKHTEDIEITFLTTQRELFLVFSTRIKI